MQSSEGGSLTGAGLSRLSQAETRSISAENPTGARGAGGKATAGTGAIAGRELGQGWKISPSIDLEPKATVALADIDGPGMIQHIWLTVHPTAWRKIVFRVFWDDETTPSIETPIGDFFCSGWCERCNVNSLPIAVNPAGGFNSYWEMPFRHHARIEIENLSSDPIKGFYYQITYALGDIPAESAYLHAHWRRSNPLPYQTVHTLLDGVRVRGITLAPISPGASTTLVGGAKVKSSSSWMVTTIGQRSVAPELKTISAAPGTSNTPQGEYGIYSTPFLGLPQVIRPDGLYRSQQRFGMYRWHIPDPIRFREDLRVTIQALGWRSQLEGQRRYLPLQDDIASTAFWYQTEPHNPFPAIGTLNDLEVI